MSQNASQIELRPNRSGRPRAYITGTRVRVQDVYALSQVHGDSPEAITRALPHLSLAQVRAALGYYAAHRDEILQELREDAAYVASLRSELGEGPMEAKLRSAE
jgi:uncharacterized protein (DUF433 family)